MKFYRMWLAMLFVVMGMLAMPAAAQACGGGCGKSGMMFNEKDGKYYSVPASGHCRVYRAVDNKYVPVHGCCYKKWHHCKKHHKCWHKCMVGVRCEVRPGHWWMTTWVPASKECWYVR